MVLRRLLFAFLFGLLATQPLSADDASRYGINAHAPVGTILPALLDETRAAGIGWVRIDLHWSWVQPSAGVYDFTVYDALISAAKARGLSVFAQVQSTPAWATDGPAESGVPRSSADFVAFVSTAARRYAGSVSAWSLWNEPNLLQFWAGTRQQFIDVILKPGADAIHAASPGVLVATPELAHLQGNGALWYRWLPDLLAQAGTSRIDVVTHHVYGTTAAAVTAKLDASTSFGTQPQYWDFISPSVREVLISAGWFGRPFWLTEVGWATDVTTEDDQARQYADLLDAWFTGKRGQDWIDKVFFYELIDDSAPGVQKFGILRSDRTEKPAYAAYKSFIAAAEAPSNPVRVVPIVLDAYGKGGAQFSSQLGVTNVGSGAARLTLTYTAASTLNASGSGTVSETLQPGRQLLIPDALEYLRDKGLAIPDASAARSEGGTLRIAFEGVTRDELSFAGARTMSPSGDGRAGLAYGAPRVEETATLPVSVFGLRETAADRSNLALLNAGTAGSITLRVTLHDGSGRSVPLTPDTTLAPGQWAQLNSVLSGAGMTNGWATVERVTGQERFLAYGVFNDNVTNDGSYVPALPSSRAAAVQVIPALVETASFNSELVLTNPTSSTLIARLSYVESLATAASGSVDETLAPFEQRILPQAIDYLRGKGVPVGPRGGSYAGALTVTFSAPDGFAGARTASPAAGGGAYGVFYPGVSPSEASYEQAWVFGLQQDSTSRSNLAFANAGTAPVTLQYEVYNGATGARVGTAAAFELQPGAWRQVSGVLSAYGVSQGYVRVLRTAGVGPFVAYGVVNDGATPGTGTGDGSYVEMSGVK